MLIRRLLPADLLTPLSAYLSLQGEGASLLLESADHGESLGRHSFVLLEEGEEIRLPPPAKGWVETLRAFAEASPNLEPVVDPHSPLMPLRDALPVGVGVAGGRLGAGVSRTGRGVARTGGLVRVARGCGDDGREPAESSMSLSSRRATVWVNGLAVTTICFRFAPTSKVTM